MEVYLGLEGTIDDEELSAKSSQSDSSRRLEVIHNSNLSCQAAL